MNLKLFPNEVKIDFIFGNKDLFRVPDEIKQISFNKSGSLVGISTKLNKFYLYDYFGHNLIGIILYFHELQYKIKTFCFDEKNNLYIIYEDTIQEDITNTRIKKINLEKEFKNINLININNKDEYIIPISEEKRSEHEIFNESTNAKIFDILIDNEKLLISGNNPYIYDLKTKKIFYIFKQNKISLLPNNIKQKDLQIYIDNNDKIIKDNEKKEENKEKNKDEVNNKDNNHFIIFDSNNIDSDSVGQNNSILDNKNNNDNINKNKNNIEIENIESNNVLKAINLKHNSEEIKEVDINIKNEYIQNNDNINNLNSNNNINNTKSNNNIIKDGIKSDNIEIKITEKKYNPNAIFIRFGYNSNTFYLIVKELYIFLILHLKNQTNSLDENNKEMIIEEEKYPSLELMTKSIHSFKKMRFFDFIKDTLNDQLYISRISDLNGEIINVELNTRNNLILINSNDRVVRLFEIINDSIILQKEYCDSVNKRKYTNCYFYTYKLKSGIQDLILMALNDSNGLEFSFIDIVTGNVIKKLETFKYTISDFVCHYQNHFSILIFSGKKIFCINGVMANQVDCLAPGLKFVEENVEYIEEESFYDNFDEKMRKQIHMENNNEEKIEDIFSKKTKKDENIFIKIDYDNEIKTNNGIEREKSINELKELFTYVGQQIQ